MMPPPIPVPKRDQHQILHITACAHPLFAECCGICVVLENDGDPQLTLDCVTHGKAFESGEIRRADQHARFNRIYPGMPMPTPSHAFLSYLLAYCPNCSDNVPDHHLASGGILGVARDLFNDPSIASTAAARKFVPPISTPIEYWCMRSNDNKSAAVCSVEPELSKPYWVS